MIQGIKGCEDWVDDILIHGRDEQEHDERLSEFLRRCKEWGVVINAAKSQIRLSKVRFIGHVWSADGVTLDPERISAIQRIATPKTVKQLRGLIGAVSWVREFVPDLGPPMAILTSLAAESDKTITWTAEALQAVKDLKDAVARSVTLSYPRHDLPWTLTSDASCAGMGAVLTQTHENGIRRPIAFMAKKWNRQQARWSTVEQECFAIVASVAKFSPLVGAAVLNVECDHRNLSALAQVKSPKVTRWMLSLMEHPLVIRYLPGRDNGTADFLSRTELDPPPTQALTISYAATEAAGAQVTQPAVGGDRHNGQPITPEEQHRIWFNEAHSWRIGHLGVQKTLHHLRLRQICWPAMRTQVAQWVRECPTCQLTARRRDMGEAELKTIKTDQIMLRVDMDTLGPLTADSAGNRYVIAAVDAMSRWTELKAVPTTEAIYVAQFIEELTCRFGGISEFRTDRGSQFVNQVVNDLLKFRRIAKSQTIGYSPTGNAIAERSLYEVTRHLRAIIFDARVEHDWSKYLPFVAAVINNTVHSATGFAPKQLIYADAIAPHREMLPPREEEGAEVPATEYVRDLQATHEVISQLSREHQARVLQQRMQEPGEATQYEVGSYVLVAPYTRRPKKLGPSWLGPYRVLAQYGNRVECEDLLSGRVREIKVDRLRQFHLGDNVDPREVAAIHDSGSAVPEEVVGHRFTDGNPRQLELHMRWLGWDLDDEVTWEPIEELRHLDMVQAYLRQHGLG